LTGPSDASESETSSTPLPLALMTIATALFVAYAVDGVVLLPPPANPSGPALWGIRLLGASLALAGLVGLLTYRNRRRKGDGPPSAGGSWRRTATIMGLVTLVGLLLRPPMGSEDRAGLGPGSPRVEAPSDSDSGSDASSPSGLPGGRGGPGGFGPGGGSGGSGRGAGIPTTQPPEGGLLERLAGNIPLQILLFLALFGVLMLWLRRTRGSLPAYADLPLDQGEAESALELSLAALATSGTDPREQITAAYHRLLTALAAAGAPRWIQEAPHEHLFRSLGPLGVRPEPLHRLTGLYVMAEFSERPVTNRHRAAAAEALEVSLSGLRAMRGEASPAALPSSRTGARA
jgi:hypothetical protein